MAFFRIFCADTMARLFLIHAAFSSLLITAEEITVQTRLGDIRGKTETVDGTPLKTFLTIPYAEPPVGDLRFRRPVPKAAWDGVMDATKYGPSCHQVPVPRAAEFLPNIDFSEDCLHLHVYVPVTDDRGPKAVMVFIHGGGYRNGQGMFSPCERLSIHGDVICVTINYRLDIFGFISTLDNHASGNYGLWDQHAALKWVKDNIDAFGGDPNAITVFGISAGGSSVAHHAVTRHSKGLFKRAIIQSSVTFSNGYDLALDPLKIVRDVGRLLGCNTRDNTDLTDNGKLVECLRGVAAEDLLNASNTATEMSTREGGVERIGPVEDGMIVPHGIKEHFSSFIEKPLSAADNILGTIDLIVGSTSDEGNVFLYLPLFTQQVLGFDMALGIPKHVMDTLLKPIAVGLSRQYQLPEFARDLESLIREKYNLDSDDIIANSRALRDLYSHITFNQQVPETALAHIKAKANAGQNSAGTYVYHLTRKFPGQTFLGALVGIPLPEWALEGASHGDDAFYVSGGPGVMGKLAGEIAWNEEDQKITNTMMTHWTNFAKTGNPNQGRSLQDGVKWEEYTSESKAYLNYDDILTMKSNLLSEYMEFWTRTIPKLVEEKRKELKMQKTEL
ncbi:carboxylesterase 5A [Lingula anatina]|uniref:Carboxylic ester hydrolase n=1 Tax=Lingula anatina TaxID=7574 RepID=A0A1S3IDR1_LINAN|nr:carboxylesterase 5A [Lingula anatina]|eukprot:XP_013396372.1 carboxylesterase 5A [Lingula anatina]